MSFDNLLDARRGNCFTTIGRNGQCRNKLAIKLTKKDCCCGINMGKGWGDNGVCEMCPLVSDGKISSPPTETVHQILICYHLM